MLSILNSVKKVVGVPEEDDSFDIDLIMHINTVFSILTQLGVGPADGFSITNDKDEWTAFTGDNHKIEMVKSYVGLKVRFLFDPPTSSAVMECMKRMCDEMEWRLHVEFNN